MLNRKAEWFTVKSTGIAHVWVGEEYPLCFGDTKGDYCDHNLVEETVPGDVLCSECLSILDRLLNQKEKE
jgi:hypothetical protein